MAGNDHKTSAVPVVEVTRACAASRFASGVTYAVFAAVIVVVASSCATNQSIDPYSKSRIAALGDDTKYLMSYKKEDPRFMTGIQRVGLCKLPGPPSTKGVAVPWELYPPESVGREEGTVTMRLLFDADWCVRKAWILKSSGFWRLDSVSLRFVMTIKLKSDSPEYLDGEPTATFPIAWGASQQGRKSKGDGAHDQR